MSGCKLKKCFYFFLFWEESSHFFLFFSIIIPIFLFFASHLALDTLRHSHSPWSAEWTSVHFDEVLSQSRWSRKEQASSYLQSISASQRTRCLSRCWWWVSPLEHRWVGLSLGSKRPNHWDDKVLSNCYRVSVQQTSSCIKRSWKTRYHYIHCYIKLNVVFKLLYELSRRCHRSSVKKKSAYWQTNIRLKWSQRAGIERLVHTSIYRLTNITVLPKLMKASLCRAHGHAEVEHSLSTNNKLSTMNVLCCQTRQTTKDVVRVTGHGQAHVMPITQSLMQYWVIEDPADLLTVYTKPVEHQKRTWRKPKSRDWKTSGKRRPKNKRKPSCLWRGRSEGWKIEKNLSVRKRRNARSKWLKGCMMRPTEGYRKP